MRRTLLPLLALLYAPAAFAGWQADLQQAAADCASDPTPCDAVESYRPYPARDGSLRFRATPGLEDPSTHPILLHRLLTEGEPAVRHAYADLLARLLRSSDPRWYPAWEHFAAHDAQPEVRHAMIVGLRRAPLEVAAPGLRAALRHDHAPTRALAVFEMGGHAQATTFLPEVRSSLGDGHPEVRARAAQVAGWLGDPVLVADLSGLLGDLSGEVRGYALLSILALDSARAQAAAARLTGDSHPRVQAAFRAIARQR